MSRRRRVTVLALAALGAASTAPTAVAATKTVIAGGPPPKAANAGSLRFPAALDLNGFFRARVTVHVGDTVRWLFSHRVVHTVTFLAPGQPVPTLEVQDPAHPYTGFTDARDADFWFNGQPSLLIPPDHAFPTGGGTTDGTAYRNSGLSAPQFKPYKLTFTKTGTFRYVCLVHPGMVGTVHVVPTGRRVPSARADRRARIAELRRSLRRARQLAKFDPAGNRVVAGHDAGAVSWFRFFPRVRTVKIGHPVRFSISSTTEIHTVAFGPTAYRDNIEKSLVIAQ